MAKTSNSQKVIEAEANLQLAKFLEALKKTKETREDFEDKFEGIWSNYDNRIETDSWGKVIEALEASKEGLVAHKQMLERCENIENIKLLEDITDGIQLKAQYEGKIKELEERLVTGQRLYTELQESVQELKDNFIKSFTQMIEGEKEKEVIDTLVSNIVLGVKFDQAVETRINKWREEQLKENAEECEVEDSPF